MPRVLLVLPVLLSLGACAISTSRSNIVVVTDNKAVIEPCTKLGEVDGSSTIGKVLLLDKARDAALARLKIAGADLGGTHVLTPVADIKWKGPATTGTVYKCSL